MSEKNHEFGSLVCIYAQLLPRIREAAKKLGYAIAIHGSMNRDFDLLAVPWVDDAADPAVLVEEVRSAVGGYIIGDGVKANGHVSEEPYKMPHGRLSWNICWGGKPFLDLAVMPRLTPDASTDRPLV